MAQSTCPVDTWDFSELLGFSAAAGSGYRPYALVVLNTPISAAHGSGFMRLWGHASLRVCADGAANRVLDAVGQDTWGDTLLPTEICGDLDSLRDDVRAFFAARGVPIVRVPTQYATDMQKGVRRVEDAEALSRAPAYHLVIFGGLSGRVDQTVHTLHVLWQLAPGVPETPGVEYPDEGHADARAGRLAKRAHAVVVSDESVTCLLPAGTHELRHNRAVLGKSCGLLPLGTGPPGARISTEGLEWNLNGEASWLGGLLSTSNHLAPGNAAGIVRLTNDAPVYWTVEWRGGKTG
ncbi:ribonuclease Z [Malassezia sp. CBS 17886]|nr:ribonuclease Z [Malassezia sp. CBS 17886]